MKPLSFFGVCIVVDCPFPPYLWGVRSLLHFTLREHQALAIAAIWRATYRLAGRRGQ